MRCSWVLVAGLLLPLAGVAQTTLPWPREKATNKVVFTGLLAWPDTVRTESQRQTLAWRWYRRGLTSDGPAHLRKLAEAEGTTYAALPRESCYQLRVAGPDNEGYRLCFRLQLIADPGGLRYQLDEFEAYSWSFDTMGSYSLEDALSSAGTEGQAVLANFRRRLATALRGW